MEAFIVILVLVVIIGWIIFVQVGARQQLEVETEVDESAARAVVRRAFGMGWSEAYGPGEASYTPKLRSRAPTISASVSGRGNNRAVVTLWASEWQSKFGLMNHAQLAWRKKRSVAGRLRAATPSTPQPAPRRPAA